MFPLRAANFVNSRMLYQLSYRGITLKRAIKPSQEALIIKIVSTGSISVLSSRES